MSEFSLFYSTVTVVFIARKKLNWPFLHNYTRKTVLYLDGGMGSSFFNFLAKNYNCIVR
jgi:hypothetical protein